MTCETVCLADTIYDSHDPVLLNRYVQCLVGQPYLFSNFSYGDEQVFHFGEFVPRGADKKFRRSDGHGCLRLCCRASEITTGLSNHSVGQTVQHAEVNATPQGYNFVLRFSDGDSLVVTPVVDDIKTVADWELKLPEQHYLRVGCGLVWSCLPTNLPINELELLAPETFGTQLLPA